MLSPDQVQRAAGFRFSIRSLLLFLLMASTALFVFAKVRSFYNSWELGEKFDERVIETSGFAVRIRAYHERGAFLAASGGFYEYAVKNDSDATWRRIAFFRLPLPEEIPEDQVIQITDEIVFFFHDFIFGVTVDGGKRWSLCGGEYPPLATSVLEKYSYIDDVQIGANGEGSMCVSNYDPVTREKRPCLKLSTFDYGQTWIEQSVNSEDLNAESE